MSLRPVLASLLLLLSCLLLSQAYPTSTKDADSYFNHGLKWNHSHITYQIVHYTEDLPKEKVDMIFRKAFDTWAEISPLTFTKQSERTADIKISFLNNEDHDRICASPFGSHTLSHSYLPPSGDIHINDDFTWIYSDKHNNYSSIYNEVYLLGVALHDIGHALGLIHSFNQESVMYPLIHVSDSKSHLSSEDIQKVQALYGKPEMKTNRTIPKQYFPLQLDNVLSSE